MSLPKSPIVAPAIISPARCGTGDKLAQGVVVIVKTPFTLTPYLRQP